MKQIVSSTILFALLLGGCTKPTVIHPGAVNAFDSNTYDVLITEQAAINQAKASIDQYPQLKTQLNSVIDQYEITKQAYTVYHLAATKGVAGDTTLLQQQVAGLVMNVANLVKGMVK